MSEIDKKYAALGGANGILGKPRDVEKDAHGGGRFRDYDRGSIYWHPQIGAHEVHGAIRDKWAALGWETGPLGYPISDETEAAEGGRFNNFQRGALHWQSAPDVPLDFAVHLIQPVKDFRLKPLPAGPKTLTRVKSKVIPLNLPHFNHTFPAPAGWCSRCPMAPPIDFTLPSLLQICGEYKLSLASTALPPPKLKRQQLKLKTLLSAIVASGKVSGNFSIAQQLSLKSRTKTWEKRSTTARDYLPRWNDQEYLKESNLEALIPRELRSPTVTITAIEAPYRLIISPNKYAVWLHAPKPVTSLQSG